MDLCQEYIVRRVIRYSFFLAAGCALCFLFGCQEKKLTLNSGPATTAPKNFADYVRNEPSVRSVEAWDNPYAPGLIIKTRHYRIYTTLLDPLMLRQVPGFVEAAFHAYESQLPRPLDSQGLMDVYLFDTRGQWEAFTKLFMGPEAGIYMHIKKGAYTAKGVCVSYNIGRKQTFSVIGHEGWHQFNHHLFAYRLPSWLDEGIATLFETCRYTQGRFVFEPGKNLMRLGSLKQTMQKGRLIPLDRLIQLNPGQVINGYGNDEEAVVAFYAQNYALVRFLREHNYGIRLRNYHAMLLGGAEGTWPLQDAYTSLAADRTRPLTVGWNMTVSPVLFDYYINEDLRRLNAEYQAFCGKITYRVRLGK